MILIVLHNIKLKDTQRYKQVLEKVIGHISENQNLKTPFQFQNIVKRE